MVLMNPRQLFPVDDYSAEGNATREVAHGDGVCSRVVTLDFSWRVSLNHRECYDASADPIPTRSAGAAMISMDQKLLSLAVPMGPERPRLAVVTGRRSSASRTGSQNMTKNTPKRTQSEQKSDPDLVKAGTPVVVFKDGKIMEERCKTRPR